MQYTSSSENYSTTLRDSPSKWGGGGRNDKGYAYKKSSYQYSSSGDNNLSYQSKTADQNIDQLDALLEDLKNERQVSNRERELLPTSSYRTLERTDPSGTVTKTTRVIKTTKHAGGQPLTDDIETLNTTDYSTLKSGKYSSFQDSLKRDEYQSKEKPYTIAHSPVGHYESKSKLYESNRKINNAELIPTGSSSTTKTLTSTGNIDKELQDIALSDGILPAPGTKVTTTVRTYTYEIPATGPGSSINTNTINRSVLHSNQHHETLSSSPNYTQLPPTAHVPQVPQTVVYNTESYSTLNRNNERPVVSNQSYEIREHKETTTNTLHNGAPGAPGGLSPQPRQLAPFTAGSPNGPSNRTIVYNIHKTDNVHTVNELPPPQRYPHSPAHSPNYAAPRSPSLQNLPPGGTTNHYFYKETSNTVNTVHGPPNGAPYEPPTQTQLAPLKQQPPTASYPQPQNGNGYPPHGDGYPPNTSYTYKYSSTTNTNNRRGPDYGAPSPFPVDGVEYPLGNGNPPQRVDDLMQSFGTTDRVDRVDLETPHRKREIDTSVASPNQQHVPSVNKAGKEVYYPPGHDTIITKREEMHAGSAAGGRWAKGSGMYEYDSGYKSKTKTKSGGAMVPVCLPLCCAMPCSIM